MVISPATKTYVMVFSFDLKKLLTRTSTPLCFYYSISRLSVRVNKLQFDAVDVKLVAVQVDVVIGSIGVGKGAKVSVTSQS